MKKYAIVIGEKNEELSKQVQEALRACGIMQTGGNEVGNFDCPLIVVKEGAYWWDDFDYGQKFVFGNSEYEFIAPSYVLAHASELDGAKKPWEIAEAGRRFVTDDERKLAKPECARSYIMEESGHAWLPVVGEIWSPECAYTVPIGFTFPPPVARMTHAEICKALGKNIEIIKESE